MKHFKLTLLFVGLIATTGVAQTTKGKWMLGSTVGISTNAPLGLGTSAAENHAGVNFINSTYKYGNVEDRINSTLVSISPSLGYFVADGAMVGLNIGFSFFSTEGDDNVILTAITPQFRYYFLNDKKMRPFAELRGGPLLQKVGDEDLNTAYLIGGRGGLAFFVNDKVSLDVFLDYTNATLPEDQDKNRPKATNAAFGFGLGFSFFL